VKLLKGHVAFLAPINLVEELARSRSRVVAPTLWQHVRRRHLVALIARCSAVDPVVANAIWKSFDMFVGAIQGVIFALLTILTPAGRGGSMKDHR
jgi:F-type H+-transporting ATPase subunit a